MEYSIFYGKIAQKLTLIYPNIFVIQLILLIIPGTFNQSTRIITSYKNGRYDYNLQTILNLNGLFSIEKMTDL